MAGILATRAPSAEGAAVKVWPALPAPGELVRLPLPCPPQLIELSGYTGGARLVALWWSPFGDELMISDGTLTETGRWRGWLCFSGHPLARLFLEPYRLGDSEDEGEHRLLVDRYLGTLDVGLARDVEQLLATQPSELHALTADLSAGETEALLQRLLDVHDERERAKSPQQLHADLRAVWQRNMSCSTSSLRCWMTRKGRCAKRSRSCQAWMPGEAMGEDPPTTEAPAMMPSPTATTTRLRQLRRRWSCVLREGLQRHVAGRRRGRRQPAVCHRAATCSFSGHRRDEAAAVPDVDVPAARRARGDELVDVLWARAHH